MATYSLRGTPMLSRTFLRVSSAAAGGMLMSLYVDFPAHAQTPASPAYPPDAFVHVTHCSDSSLKLAPEAGFEPATLRLTAPAASRRRRWRTETGPNRGGFWRGGKIDVSRALPPFADLCRTLRPPAQNLAVFRFRLMPAFAALCRSLLLPKGKKRATSSAPSDGQPL